MSNQGATDKEQPPRVTLKQKRGRSIKVVLDQENQPVVDGLYYLGWHHPTGRFYLGRTDPRAYLGGDYELAIVRFRSWVARQSGRAVEILSETHPDDAAALRALMVGEDAELIVDTDGTVSRLDVIPVESFWKYVRKLLLTDPQRVARETGIPEVARLADLPKPEPSVTLEHICDLYAKKRKRPQKDELRKAKRYWDAFRRVTGARAVSDVEPDGVERWADECWAPYEAGGSPKTVRHKVEYVIRLLRYAYRMGVDKRRCDALLGEIAKVELPDSEIGDPHPIAVEHFHAALEAADTKWRAILLTSLNCCFYGVDVRTLPKKAIEFDRSVIVFDRGKKMQPRVAVLWDRTTEALRAYLEAEPHEQDVVFITQYGGPYTGQGLRNAWRYLRAKVGLPADVELAHIRDGAYTNAIAGGADVLHAQILAGHKSGIKDSYIKRNPRMVQDACRAIELHYFGESDP